MRHQMPDKAIADFRVKTNFPRFGTILHAEISLDTKYEQQLTSPLLI